MGKGGGGVAPTQGFHPCTPAKQILMGKGGGGVAPTQGFHPCTPQTKTIAH